LHIISLDLGKAADILTNGFFGENTNFFTLQIERLKTLLSLESTFPRNNMNQSTSKKSRIMLMAGLQSNGQVIGFAELDNRPIENIPPMTSKTGSTVPPPPRPYMCNLAIDAKYQRKGIATSLIQNCEDICQTYWGLDYVYLKVRKENDSAVQLYQGLGYDIVESRKEKTVTSKKKEEEEEILLMKKKLN